MGKSEDNRSYIVKGHWDPLGRTINKLTYLNEETSKGIEKFPSKLNYFKSMYSMHQIIQSLKRIQKFFLKKNE